MNEEYDMNQKDRKSLFRRFLPKAKLKVEELEDLDGMEAPVEDPRQKKIRQLIRGGGVLLVALITLTIIKSISGSMAFSKYSVTWENEMQTTSSVFYEKLGNQIIKAASDGVTGYNTNGQVVWSYGYTMRNPVIICQGSYGAIADIQSNTAVIFNSEGVQGEVKTTQPILNHSISSHGVLALELDESSVNYINFYDNTGRALDIRIKTKLSGDGYPMDLSLSSKGTGLVTSVVYLDQSNMQNQLVFYNFDVGKSDSNRMVGYFNFGETMFPQVTYLGDSAVCAFGDNQVNFYSLKNESQPKLVRSVEYTQEIYSVFHSSDRVGVISKGEESGFLLQVYDSAGNEKFEQELEGSYSHAEFSGEYVLLYDNARCMILNGKGNIRYEGTIEGNIQKIIMTGEDNCLVMGSTSMKKLRFR